jgi:hypothetical protein
VIKTIFWATLCFWGTILALFPAISILVSENAFSSSPLNSFLLKNNDALLSIGTLFLISFLAILQVHISNVSSETREKSNRKTQVEMKLAEFRNIWVSDLRDQASELFSLVVTAKNSEKMPQIRKLSTSIHLKFDPKQPEFGIVADLISKLIGTAVYDSNSTDERAIDKARSEFQIGMALILDEEWAKMKRALEEAQSFDGRAA